ncbi:MAG: hypothetical protein JRG81_00215 [Deltaproteobacteria bacterium]|nr:hypothetical protein [Deltaproteobacteria bacterium]MBW2363501.1 hypothetical protein [Deltaproteobacteria bacterium]
MRKSLFIIIAIVFLFTGCTGMNAFLESESGQAVIDHGGIIAGVMVGSNNLDKIDEVVEICDAYLKADNETVSQAALEYAATYIFKNYGQTTQNMVLMAEVQKLVGVFLKTDGTLGFLDNYNSVLLGKFVFSFRNGIAMATPRQTKFIRR